MILSPLITKLTCAILVLTIVSFTQLHRKMAIRHIVREIISLHDVATLAAWFWPILQFLNSST